MLYIIIYNSLHEISYVLIYIVHIHIIYLTLMKFYSNLNEI